MPEFEPRRGDEVEAFIKRHRDDWRATSGHDVLDDLLDAYRLHADTGTPLSVPESEIGPHGSDEGPPYPIFTTYGGKQAVLDGIPEVHDA